VLGGTSLPDPEPPGAPGVAAPPLGAVAPSPGVVSRRCTGAATGGRWRRSGRGV